MLEYWLPSLKVRKSLFPLVPCHSLSEPSEKKNSGQVHFTHMFVSLYSSVCIFGRQMEYALCYCVVTYYYPLTAINQSEMFWLFWSDLNIRVLIFLLSGLGGALLGQTYHPSEQISAFSSECTPPSSLFFASSSSWFHAAPWFSRAHPKVEWKKNGWLSHRLGISGFSGGFWIFFRWTSRGASSNQRGIPGKGCHPSWTLQTSLAGKGK